MEAVAPTISIPNYDVYKDSGEPWIAEIPQHWETQKLKHLFAEKKLKTNPALNCGSISFGRVVEKDDEKIPLSTKASYQEVLKGEFLINPLNLNYDLISLRIALSYIDVVVSSGYIVLKNIIELNKEYFKYLLHRYDVAYMKLLGSGVRQTISFNHIANSMLLFPPLEEQIAIADFLDRKTAAIDKAIAQKEALIERLKERRQILIHRAVTRGLNPDVRMKDSGVEWIGEVPEHWKILPLRYVGKCQNGISKAGDYFGTGYPFVSYGDVYKNIVLPKEVHGLVESNPSDREMYSVEAGDVFFTRTSETIEEIGLTSTCAHTIKDATFAGFLIRFRPNKGSLFSGFSKYYFGSSTNREFFIKEMNLVTRASLSQELLKRLPVLLPPIDEQRELADYLEISTAKFAKAISLKETEITKLREYKSTLINAAVTGKIKVC